jgi:hypothetical protein
MKIVVHVLNPLKLVEGEALPPREISSTREWRLVPMPHAQRESLAAHRHQPAGGSVIRAERGLGPDVLHRPAADGIPGQRELGRKSKVRGAAHDSVEIGVLNEGNLLVAIRIPRPGHGCLLLIRSEGIPAIRDPTNRPSIIAAL